MRYKVTLIKWNVHKAFGFIQPKGDGADIFIHKAHYRIKIEHHKLTTDYFFNYSG